MERFSAVAPSLRPLAVGSVSAERPPLVWAVGAHGGAGATFLAASLAFMGEESGTWPYLPPGDDTTSPYCVIVARESTSGLDAAEQALRQWHTDAELAHVRLLGLVLIEEPGAKKRGTELSAWRESVSALAPETWHLGWIPDWTHRRADELLEWWPGDPHPQKKTKYISPIPAQVASLGEKIYSSALADIERANQ